MVVKQLKELSDYERGWIEAIIDGEGCLDLIKDRSGCFIRMRVHNTDIRLTKKAEMICKSGSTHRTSAKGNRKDQYEYSLIGKELFSLLSQINLIVKEHQQELLKQAYKLYSSTSYHRIRGGGVDLILDGIKEDIQAHNKRGL